MLDTEKEITELDEKTFEVAEKIAAGFVVALYDVVGF
jgi:hypothetical protein